MNPYAELDDDALLAECTVEFRRASGPGGQHRNKVESAVRLHHGPTAITVTASERRSQAANRALAISRLRAKLEIHFHRDKPRVKTRKSRAVKARERTSKERLRKKKQARRSDDES